MSYRPARLHRLAQQPYARFDYIPQLFPARESWLAYPMLSTAAAQVHVLSCQFCTVPFRAECPPPAYSLCGFCKAVSYFLCNFRITSSKNRFDASVKLLLLDFSLEPPLFYDIGGLLFGERKRVLPLDIGLSQYKQLTGQSANFVCDALIWILLLFFVRTVE